MAEGIAVTVADERTFKVAPRESGESDGESDSQQRYDDAAEVVELRLGMQQETVSDLVESVVQNIDAIGDDSQMPEPTPAHNGGDEAAGAGKNEEEKTTVEERQPADADGERNEPGRAGEPPSQGDRTKSQENKGER